GGGWGRGGGRRARRRAGRRGAGSPSRDDPADDGRRVRRHFSRPHEKTFVGVTSTMTDSVCASAACWGYCGYFAYSRFLIPRKRGPFSISFAVPWIMTPFSCDQSSEYRSTVTAMLGVVRRFRTLRASFSDAKYSFPFTTTWHTGTRWGTRRGLTVATWQTRSHSISCPSDFLRRIASPPRRRILYVRVRSTSQDRAVSCGKDAHEPDRRSAG